jgi:integrase
MNKVEPIRDIEKVKKMKSLLKKQNFRDYLLFELGINSGLRISDLLKLKVEDVKNKDSIRLKEQKTGKSKKIKLNHQVKKAIDEYITGMDLQEYLFQSRKGDNKPISRVQAYRVLKKAGNELGIEHLGTHTLRKTFGYHHYKQNKDVALLQRIFNHNSPTTTLEYIGINQEEIDNSYNEFYI